MEENNVLAILDSVLMILSVTGGAAWLAAVPQIQKAIKYAPVVSKVLNLIAANIGGAKNRE